MSMWYDLKKAIRRFQVCCRSSTSNFAIIVPTMASTSSKKSTDSFILLEVLCSAQSVSIEERDDDMNLITSSLVSYLLRWDKGSGEGDGDGKFSICQSQICRYLTDDSWLQILNCIQSWANRHQIVLLNTALLHAIRISKKAWNLKTFSPPVGGWKSSNCTVRENAHIGFSFHPQRGPEPSHNISPLQTIEFRCTDRATSGTFYIVACNIVIIRVLRITGKTSVTFLMLEGPVPSWCASHSPQSSISTSCTVYCAVIKCWILDPRSLVG